MDITVCNGLGILIGLKICEVLEMRNYSWSGILEIPTTFGKVKRALLQFTPVSWTRVRWNAMDSGRAYLGVILLILALQLCDLNGFFLKHVLWIKSQDSIVTYRLVLWWLIGCPTIRQFYIYVTDPSVERMGTQAWVAISILLTELLVVIKLGRGMFPILVPSTHVIIGWCIGIFLLVGFSILAFYWKNYRVRDKKE